jgi:hypothetical protein
MNKNFYLWLLAFLLTIITAVYQRLTGPTYPISGQIILSENKIDYKLFRSHGGKSDHELNLVSADSTILGYLYFKRYNTKDNWTKIPMSNRNDTLKARLPYQPPAGKLEYFIELIQDQSEVRIPLDNSIVIRFKGEVPLSILIPHIIAMFMSMMLSNRTGLEFFNNGKNIFKLTYWTLLTLFVGGFILGPLTQYYAFGELWTGFPFGHDLTDNKTLIALIGWIIALFMYKRSKLPRNWALFASLLLLVVYLIPHSLLGSELDYKKLDTEKKKLEEVIQD